MDTMNSGADVGGEGGNLLLKARFSAAGLPDEIEGKGGILGGKTREDSYRVFNMFMRIRIGDAKKRGRRGGGGWRDGGGSRKGVVDPKKGYIDSIFGARKEVDDFVSRKPRNGEDPGGGKDG